MHKKQRNRKTASCGEVLNGVWGTCFSRAACASGRPETALLFEAGMDVVKARSLASVGIIATGSELRDFVCRAEGPTRVSSDAAYLRSLLLDAGIRDVWARSAADDSAAIAAALTGLAVRSDVLITIGGTGRGSKISPAGLFLRPAASCWTHRRRIDAAGERVPSLPGNLMAARLSVFPGTRLLQRRLLSVSCSRSLRREAASHSMKKWCGRRSLEISRQGKRVSFACRSAAAATRGSLERFKRGPARYCF